MNHTYTSNVQYLHQNLSIGEVCEIEQYDRLKIDSLHPSYRDANETFSIDHYRFPYMPLFLGRYNIDITNVNVNCLRMMIRGNVVTDKIYIPKEVLFAKNFILQQINYHHQFYSSNRKCFIYLTVRTTEGNCWYKNSQTWHVDGFQGSRISTHIPEQGIIWSNCGPTEFLFQPFYLRGLDVSSHNVHEYFESHGRNEMSYSGVDNGVYLITPYNVHRVTSSFPHEKRVLIRINFSPVEIEDPTNTINPMLPITYKSRRDIRDFLWSHNVDHSDYEVNEGFVKN